MQVEHKSTRALCSVLMLIAAALFAGGWWLISLPKRPAPPHVFASPEIVEGGCEMLSIGNRPYRPEKYRWSIKPAGLGFFTSAGEPCNDRPCVDFHAAEVDADTKAILQITVYVDGKPDSYGQHEILIRNVEVPAGWEMHRLEDEPYGSPGPMILDSAERPVIAWRSRLGYPNISPELRITTWDDCTSLAFPSEVDRAEAQSLVLDSSGQPLAVVRTNGGSLYFVRQDHEEVVADLVAEKVYCNSSRFSTGAVLVLSRQDKPSVIYSHYRFGLIPARLCVAEQSSKAWQISDLPIEPEDSTKDFYGHSVLVRCAQFDAEGALHVVFNRIYTRGREESYVCLHAWRQHGKWRVETIPGISYLEGYSETSCDRFAIGADGLIHCLFLDADGLPAYGVLQDGKLTARRLEGEKDVRLLTIGLDGQQVPVMAYYADDVLHIVHGEIDKTVTAELLELDSSLSHQFPVDGAGRIHAVGTISDWSYWRGSYYFCIDSPSS